MGKTNSETIIYKRFQPFSDEVVKDLCDKIKKCKTRTKNKIEYFDIPAAFDIETSLIETSAGYVSTMYIWQFGVGVGNTNYIIYGRHWEEFEKLINRLGYMLRLSEEKRRLVIYIHNASYEFSFIARRFNWNKVFCMKPHKPLFFTTESGIEFRCSLLLSGLRLSEVGKGLTKYKAKKRTGDLDYSLVRGISTPLTKEELMYCVDDIHVLLNYIREVIEMDGGITKIPYTKTGYARLHTRRMCFGTSHKKGEGRRKYDDYHRLMSTLTISLDEYEQAKYCFTGGFTHDNAHYTDKILYNLGAKDISSSYPAQICKELFPMSSPTLEPDIKTEDDPRFIEHIKEHCCIFYIMLYDLEPIIEYENFLSSSKVYKSENVIENNGRVVSMDRGLTCITEVDYQIMQRCYKWSHSKIIGFRWMEKGYLPKDFIISVLTLYRDKTRLKKVKGQEAFYMRQKSILNAEYGMMVQRAIQELILFEDSEDGMEFKIDESKTEEELIEKYNNNRQRFTYYYWGIWVCKYAMRQLWDAIFYLKNDYVYTDTDSVKYRHPEKHTQYFNDYNEMVQKKLRLMCDYYSLPYGYIEPRDIKGNKQPLGIWDTDAGDGEPLYRIFKTLGAKRYIYLQEDHVVMTCAGIRKEAVDYLMKTYGRIGIFQHFNSSLYVPPDESGKLTAYYTDFEFEGDAVDYLGNPFHYSEMSCVAIVNSDYSLSRSQKYIDYLEGLMEYEECI